MSLLSYRELLKLVEEGVINAPVKNINGASIDITLDSDIMIEGQCFSDGRFKQVDLKNKESLYMFASPIGPDGYLLRPSRFILASSVETFNLPNNIACEYKLKSSLARSGLQHMLAGWCDPGWTNSKLTLELKNVTENHTLILRAGMKIGQMVFFKCDPVPSEETYAVKGQYNNQGSVTGNKGVR